MPRFGFPVSGRRQKRETAAVVSPPLNKVQKILGSSEINIDSTAEPPKHWASASISPIGVHVINSTYDDQTGSHAGALSSAAERTVVNGQRGGRLELFEQESGVLPRAFANDDLHSDFDGPDGLSITDASSLRRKQSSSTIVSYYDKTKVPLGISQQTSSSAMAKGLPTKASSLLDIDGSISAARRKKKPAKLELSRMFSNRKSPSAMTLNAERGPGLGPDTVTRSPSFLSVSPLEYIARPYSSQHIERRLPPATKGSMHEELLGSKRSPSQRGLRHAASQEATGLQNLYEHYEQMTFRTISANEDGAPRPDAPISESEDEVASPQLPKTVPQIYRETVEDHADYSSQGDSGEQLLCQDMSAYSGTYGHLPTLQEPVGGNCSDSISSRHTRTSKASKRTAQSLVEIDLQQTSILSLSSDSEDDLDDSRATLPSPRSQIDSRLSPEGHLPTTTRSPSSSKRKKDRTSGRYDHTTQYLPVPGTHDMQSGPLPPATMYSRTSSMSASMNSTAKPSERGGRCESRVSTASNKTTNSTGFGPGSYTVHEARAITLIPAQGASYNSAMTHNHSSSSDQLTPPLSPSSMDFMMRSNHTSVCDGDGSSLRDSVSPEWNRNPIGEHGRFMAVTRQEEMLLAALRKKRLRMREFMTVEVEGGLEKDKAMDLDNLPESSRPMHEIQQTNIDTVMEMPSPQSRSMSQASVRFSDFPMHFEDSPFPVPPSAGIRNSLRSSSAIAMSWSPPSKPPAELVSSSPTAKTTAKADIDRVLTNLNNSAVGKASSSGSGSGSTSVSDRSEDIFGLSGKRNHRLSDGLDLDDGSSDNLQSPDPFSFPMPAQYSLMDARPAREKRRFLGVDHPRFRNAGSRQLVRTAHSSDVDDDRIVDLNEDSAGYLTQHATEFVDTRSNKSSSRTVDDEEDVPRPDSPLESPLPFHRRSAVRISAVGGSSAAMTAWRLAGRATAPEL